MDELKSLRLNVSTDWAPGSSGAAVLDQCGNAIGHVSTIAPLSESSRAPRRAPRAPVETPKTPVEKPDARNESPAPKPDPGSGTPAPRAQPSDRFGGAVLITLHEAVPARGVLALARTLPGAASRKPMRPAVFDRR